MGVKWRPVVRLGNTLPKRLHLLDQHARGPLVMKIGMPKSLGSLRLMPEQSFPHRVEARLAIERSDRTCRCPALASGPAEPVEEHLRPGRFCLPHPAEQGLQQDEVLLHPNSLQTEDSQYLRWEGRAVGGLECLQRLL